jgi:hypothetical protein
MYKHGPSKLDGSLRVPTTWIWSLEHMRFTLSGSLRRTSDHPSVIVWMEKFMAGREAKPSKFPVYRTNALNWGFSKKT